MGREALPPGMGEVNSRREVPLRQFPSIPRGYRSRSRRDPSALLRVSAASNFSARTSAYASVGVCVCVCVCVCDCDSATGAGVGVVATRCSSAAISLSVGRIAKNVA